jgi:hypothetical protein
MSSTALPAGWGLCCCRRHCLSCLSLVQRSDALALPTCLRQPPTMSHPGGPFNVKGQTFGLAALMAVHRPCQLTACRLPSSQCLLCSTHR